MPFLKGKEDMGLEASLKMLDLSPDATIEDANQAYADLHQMIDRFHQDAENGSRGSREEDMELLTCAYEKAIAYLSDPSSPVTAAFDDCSANSARSDGKPADLHFTINFPGDGHPVSTMPDGIRLPEPDDSTVDDAICITERRMRQTNEALPGAQGAVDAAASEVDAAGRRHAHAKQTRINAVVAAKSAKSRALLLEIEAKRTMEEAIAAAEKARDRVAAARKAARQAKEEAQAARQEAARIRQSEETAAAEVICAQDRLEQKKAQLKVLTHSLLQTRNQMKMLQDATKTAPIWREETVSSLVDQADDDPDADRKQVLSDLLAIEAFLQAEKPGAVTESIPTPAASNGNQTDIERRRHPRMAYPPGNYPMLSVGGRSIPVLDVSSAGLRLRADNDLASQRIVRGCLTLGNGKLLKVAGKVVRNDERHLGVKLVTRIGRCILDQERMRINR